MPHEPHSMGKCLYRITAPRSIFQIKAGKGRTGQSSASHGKTLCSTSEQTSVNLRKTVYPEFKMGKGKPQPAACTGEEAQQAGSGAAAASTKQCSCPRCCACMTCLILIIPMSPGRCWRLSEVLSPCPERANAVSLPPYEDL